MTPQILVIMPVFNTRQYIEAAVRSILNQTFQDFHLLIIDDGSTDGSIDVIASIPDKRIEIIRQSNRGPSAAMNYAIDYADAYGYPFIARMDSDDISLPHRFESQIRILLDHPEAALCSSNCYYIDADDEKIIGTSTIQIMPSLIRWEIQHGLRGCIQGASIFRTATLKHIQGYRATFKRSEEVDVFLHLSENYEFANSAEFLYKIRLRSNSLSTENIHENILYNFYALDCFARRKRKQPETDFVTYCSNMNLFTRLSIQREELLLQIWRGNYHGGHKIRGILASLLDPRRVIARSLRIASALINKPASG